MMRFYTIDLRAPVDAFGRAIGCRRLLEYIRALPEDAATFREEHTSAWRDRDEIAARHYEATDYWGRVIAAVLGLKDVDKRQPAIMVAHPSRPAAQAPERKGTTLSQLKALLKGD